MGRPGGRLHQAGKIGPTPAENLAAILAECAGVDDYTRFCTVLTAFAESDFRSDAVQRETIGVFQQNPRWWPSATQGTAAQCRAFLAAFRKVSGDPVRDCWRVQRWLAPDPGVDPVGFRSAAETVNYSRRLPLIDRIIRERHLP